MKIELKNWTLRAVPNAQVPLQVVSACLNVAVPGDITDALMQNGLIEDIQYADNYPRYQWIHHTRWEYSCPVEVAPEMLEQERLFVHFGGIDTFAEIYFNERLLCRTENMFLPYDVDIKDVAHPGSNQLRVVILPVSEFTEDVQGKYFGAFHSDRLLIRKAQCHFGWDWAPEFPGSGLWRPVSLVACSHRKINWVRLRTRTDGTVTFFPELDYSVRQEQFARYRQDKLRIRVYDGDVCVAFQEFPITGYRNLCNVTIANPKLWYPNGYGVANLYRYTIEIVAEAGYTADCYYGSFGIREVVMDESPNGRERLDFRAYINGRKIFLRGSNWVPASFMTGAIPEERYRKLLLLAKHAGYNVLRVWGGGIYEKEIFYRLCDEYGILVWQDFMFACGDIPDDNDAFCRLVAKEAVYQVRRLDNHPCMLLWNGGNELKEAFAYSAWPELGKYLNDYLLAGICAKYTDVPFYPSSPWSYTDFGNDVTSGESHQCALFEAAIGGELVHFRRYIVANKPIATECAGLGPCRVRHLKKFIPEDKLWPLNEVWDLHFVNNPYEPKLPPSFAQLEKVAAESFFGEVNGLCDFVKKAMIAHAEILRGEIDYCRGDEALCGGILNWMFNDNWRNGTWAVVDYDFGCKPAYYAMKQAFAPIRVGIVLRNGNYEAFLSNHTEEKIIRTIHIGQKKPDGTVILEAETEISVAPDSVVRIPFPGTVHPEKNTYLFAATRQEKAIEFVNGYAGDPFISDLDVEISETGEENGRYTGICMVKANAFAKTVFLDAPEAFEFFPDENYFDMEPGDTARIQFSCGVPFAPADITVKTLADVWDD